MAGETLLTQAQLLASYPDNTVGAITALTGRNQIISEAVGIGFLKNTAEFVVPIDTPDQWETIQNLIVNPEVAVNAAWILNANNFWVPDYAGVILPAGVERLVSLNTEMVATTDSNSAKEYQFQYFINGVPYGLPTSITFDDDDEYQLAVSTAFTYEVATKFPIDLRVSEDVGANDLQVIDFRQTIYGILT